MLVTLITSIPTPNESQIKNDQTFSSNSRYSFSTCILPLFAVKFSPSIPLAICDLAQSKIYKFAAVEVNNVRKGIAIPFYDVCKFPDICES